MEGPSSSAAARLGRGEGEIQRINLRVSQPMESGYLFPERPGEPDCDYYIRTGHCRFGMSCKFNHPPNRNLVVVAATMRGGYPERAGQPECQYYLRTGSCKFGATCKFHHPREKAGILGQVQLNVLGYPLHPNEKECSYYLRTGQCKFGNTCKFHHPEPSNTEYAPPGSPIYPSVQSHTAPSAQSYPGGSGQWSLSRAYSSQRWQSPSYTQLVLPQGLVHVPGWTAYSGQLGDSSSDSQLASGALHFYNTPQQSDSNRGAQGSFTYQPVGMYPVQSETIFPERPDQPECQYYMKTGDCKFGALCKFHHPRERYLPPPDSVLSAVGLPLRPGEPVCRFYSRYGICKFGPSCKFDHPMGIISYGPSASSIEDNPAVWHPSVSLVGPVASMLSSEGPRDPSSAMSQQIRISEAQIASGNQDSDAD